MNEEKYNVVISTLQEKHDKLWKMTQQNMEHNSFNIMDQIRLKHIDQLKSAMAFLKEHQHEWVDEE